MILIRTDTTFYDGSFCESYLLWPFLKIFELYRQKRMVITCLFFIGGQVLWLLPTPPHWGISMLPSILGLMSGEDHKKFGRLAICALIDVLNCLIETLIWRIKRYRGFRINLKGSTLLGAWVPGFHLRISWAQHSTDVWGKSLSSVWILEWGLDLAIEIYNRDHIMALREIFTSIF